MDHGVDAQAERTVNHSAIRNGANDIRICSRRYVETEHDVARAT
jgi:hypothetical protein